MLGKWDSYLFLAIGLSVNFVFFMWISPVFIGTVLGDGYHGLPHHATPETPPVSMLRQSIMRVDIICLTSHEH